MEETKPFKISKQAIKLAFETVKLEVTMGNNPYKGDEIPLMVAKRDAVSEIYDL